MTSRAKSTGQLIVQISCVILFSVITLYGMPRSAFGQGQFSIDPQDPIFQTLLGNNVYVDPAINGIDIATLEQAAAQSQQHPHTFVKIAFTTTIPVQGASPASYAYALHSALRLGKNGLEVIYLRTPTQGSVEVETSGLDASERTRLAREAAPNIKMNPTEGAAALASSIARDVNSREYRSSEYIWMFVLLIVVVIVVLIVIASKKRKAAVAEARVPADMRRRQVLQMVEALDAEINDLPPNNPDCDRAKALRQSAALRFGQGAKVLDRATELSDISRAEQLFEAAYADAQRSREYVDFVSGKSRTRPVEDTMVDPLPETADEAAHIPANRRGVSFFSSQPAPISSLVPVTVQIGGQSRQVLVTHQEADELRAGRMPQMRVFYDNGNPIPWYQYNSYDPYRDYWYAESSMWNGLALGVIASEMMSPMWIPAYDYPMYAGVTDSPMFQSYGSDQGYGYGQNYGDNYNNGGADFGGGYNDPGNYDNNGSPTDNGGGFDGGGGADFGGGFDGGGGADFGGGFDGGGGDSSF